MGSLSVHCPGPAPVIMGADDQVGECPALTVVFVDIAVAVAVADAVVMLLHFCMFLCLYKTSIIHLFNYPGV